MTVPVPRRHHEDIPLIPLETLSLDVGTAAAAECLVNRIAVVPVRASFFAGS